MNRKLLATLAMLAAASLADASARSQTNGPPPRPTIDQAFGHLTQNLETFSSARAWLSVVQDGRRRPYLLYAGGGGDVTIDSVGHGATRVHLHQGALTWSGGGARDVEALSAFAPVAQRLFTLARSGFSGSQITWQAPAAPILVGYASRWARVALPPPDDATTLFVAFDDGGMPTAASFTMPGSAATVMVEVWQFGAPLPRDVFQATRPDVTQADPLNLWWLSEDVGGGCLPRAGGR